MQQETIKFKDENGKYHMLTREELKKKFNQYHKRKIALRKMRAVEEMMMIEEGQEE